MNLQVSLFGGFQALLDGRPLAFHSNRVRALLAYLLVEPGRPHPRETLAALLWDEYEERAALTNLRNALSQLNRTLAPLAAGRGGRPNALVVTRQSVRFNVDEYPVLLDVVEFDGLFAACERHPHTALSRCYLCLARLARAADLHRGDFMAGLTIRKAPAFEEWRRAHAEQRHARTLAALNVLVEHYAHLSDYAETQRYARRIVALEPWREDAHRRLMLALAQGGETVAALAQYEICRRYLREELGAEPSAETTELYQRLRAGSLPAPSSATLRHFPVTFTPFVGYQAELAQVVEKLWDPDCRLLTVLGPGGIGKTRLCLEAARRVAGWPDFSDGVYFVPLSNTQPSDGLSRALSARLGLALHPPSHSPAQPQLFEVLAHKKLLIVLDGFEHVLAAAESVEFVRVLLEAAPAVKCLVSSRAPLYLRAEWRQSLNGLTYPAPGEHPDDLSGYTAVELFVRLAAQIRPQFSLGPNNMSAVARICQLVEGLPLALELAAAWADRYSCAEMAEAIAGNLDFLTTPLLDVPAAHRSLRAVFEASWQRLRSVEQWMLMQISVFDDGFTADAVEEAVRGLRPSEVRAALTTLTEHSLLRQTPDGRYYCQALLRQFAAAKSKGPEGIPCLPEARTFSS